MDEIINVVDREGRRTGTITKLLAHETGQLHEAFSIFIFNSKGELLLQRRARTKYHSGGLWTNTCCGHPREGEMVEKAAHRRLFEEMGMRCDMKKVSSFLYRTELLNGLIEHEFDYIFVGRYDDSPLVNPQEVDEYYWVTMSDLLDDIKTNPDSYTYWLKEIMKQPKFLDYVQKISS